MTWRDPKHKKQTFTFPSRPNDHKGVKVSTERESRGLLPSPYGFYGPRKWDKVGLGTRKWTRNNHDDSSTKLGVLVVNLPELEHILFFQS